MSPRRQRGMEGGCVLLGRSLSNSGRGDRVLATGQRYTHYCQLPQANSGNGGERERDSRTAVEIDRGGVCLSWTHHTSEHAPHLPCPPPHIFSRERLVGISSLTHTHTRTVKLSSSHQNWQKQPPALGKTQGFVSFPKASCILWPGTWQTRPCRIFVAKGSILCIRSEVLLSLACAGVRSCTKVRFRSESLSWLGKWGLWKSWPQWGTRLARFWQRIIFKGRDRMAGRTEAQ